MPLRKEDPLTEEEESPLTEEEENALRLTPQYAEARELIKAALETVTPPKIYPHR